MKQGFICLTIVTALTAGTARAQTADTEVDAKQLVWEAWRAVSEQYYDPNFGGADWPAIGGEYLSASYADVPAAYAAIREMLGKLHNPAARFLNPAQAQHLLDEFNGDLGTGLGLIELLSVDTNEKTGNIVVVTPVAGTPAAEAGLKAGDIIVSVDGQSAEGMGLADVMSALRGPAGTTVRVTLSRNGATRKLQIERRDAGHAVQLESRVIDVGGIPIGYLGLRGFNQQAPELFLNAVKDMEGQGVDAYVLDLRNNPGGYVASVSRIGAAFLGAKPLASLEMRGGTQQIVADGPQLSDAPLAVLINEGTASAAEVLSSAIKFYKRGTVLGIRSFGKGFAHGYALLSDGSAVTPTLGRLKSLAGVDILNQGIQPDVEVPMDRHPVVDDGIEAAGKDDVQFQAAVERLLAPGN